MDIKSQHSELDAASFSDTNQIATLETLASLGEDASPSPIIGEPEVKRRFDANDANPEVQQVFQEPVAPTASNFADHPCAIALGVSGIYSGKHQSLSSFISTIKDSTSIKLNWVRTPYKSLVEQEVAIRPTDTIFKPAGNKDGKNIYDKLGAFSSITGDINPDWRVARNEEYTTLEELQSLKNSDNASDVAEYTYQKKRLSGIALGAFNGKILPENYEPNSSRIIPLDFDKLSSDELVRLKPVLCSIPEIVFCFTSISGAGLKAGLCVGSIKDDVRYKQCFYYAREWLKSIDSNLILDESGKDIKRLIFTSYDPEAYFNSAAVTLVVPDDYVVPSIYNNKPQHLDNFKPNETTRALMGELDDSFLCNETNKDKLRIGAGELYKANGNTLSEAAWYFEFVCPFKNLVEQGWPEEEAYALFDEVCQQMDGYVEGKNRKRWDEQTPPTSGPPRTYKSILKHAPKKVLAKKDNSDGSASAAIQGVLVNEDGDQGVGALNEAGFLDTNDIGLARRLYLAAPTNLKYVVGQGFIYYLNDCWRWDVDGAATRQFCSIALAETLVREAEELLSLLKAAQSAEDDWMASLYRHARRAVLKAKESVGNDKTRKNITKVFAERSSVRLSSNLLDANPDVIGIANATMLVDLKTGEVRKVVPEDYITRSLAVSSVGGLTKCVKWLKLLDGAFEGDALRIAYFQRLLGYCLTGHISEHKLFMVFGPGGNGKGAIDKVCSKLWGTNEKDSNTKGYGAALSPESLTDKKRSASGPSSDLIPLERARLAIVSETDSGVSFNEPLVKRMTGGDLIIARGLYKDHIAFRPEFKPLIFGNVLPNLETVGAAMASRVIVIPTTCTNYRAAENNHLIIKDLDDQIIAEELPHVFAWCLEGAKMYYAEGGLGDAPSSISDTVNEYFDDEDIIGKFVLEKCVVNPNTKATTYDLFNSWTTFAREENVPLGTQAELTRRLKSKGFSGKIGGVVQKINNRQALIGIRPKTIEEICWEEKNQH